MRGEPRDPSRSDARSGDPLESIFGIDQARERSGHPAAVDDETLMSQCELRRGRSSGPGGQHRNKTETHVELFHRPTGLSAQAGERRSPETNRKVAIRRLRLELATQIRVEAPVGEARTKLWFSRVRNGRILCSPKSNDFPAMLAEAMDMVFTCKLDVRRASTRLACTMSQLLKLLREHPPAFEKVNAARVERGLHPLK